jgi:hypothetical protein
MRYLKYTQYVYLIVALFSFYKAFDYWNDGTDQRWLFTIIGVMALIMFFVRRKFANKFNSPNNKP